MSIKLADWVKKNKTVKKEVGPLKFKSKGSLELDIRAPNVKDLTSMKSVSNMKNNIKDPKTTPSKMVHNMDDTKIGENIDRLNQRIVKGGMKLNKKVSDKLKKKKK